MGKKEEQAAICDTVRTLMLRNEDWGSGDFAFAKESPGEAECRYCQKTFHSDGISITLYSADICPSCIIAGPVYVARLAEGIAHDGASILRMWGPLDLDPDDVDGIAGDYLNTAEKCTGIRSFEELGGGKVAVALAAEITRCPKSSKQSRKAA